MKLTLWYSVQNGGDGSAYPQFMESEELAEWDQDHLDDGWGESCTGSITVSGDKLKVVDKVDTKESYYVDMILNDRREQDIVDFKEQFFPSGRPEFKVKILDATYYGIYLKRTLVAKHWGRATSEAGRKSVEQLINRTTPSQLDVMS